jgi:histidinol phosphatase-like enzyme
MQTECSAALFGFACVEGAAEAIRQLNEARFMAIVVTNQPAVARGEYTPDVLRLFHNILVSRGVVSTRSAQS